MTELALPRRVAAGGRRPRLGIAMIAAAAGLFAFNGVVSKVVLSSGGLPSARLTELRSAGAFAGLALVLLVTRPRSLAFGRRELPLLVFYGVCGFAIVQWVFFVAIGRLPIGVALIIQFTAPVLVALWARFAWHEPVRRRVWAALALSLGGLALVAEAWDGFTLDAVGVAAAGLASVTLAVYFLGGEHGIGRRDPLSLVCLALGFAALAWSIVLPWWSFPFEVLAADASLLGALDHVSLPVWLLCVWIIVPGTIFPFTLSIAALGHLPATHVSVIAMLEPVFAAAAAWLWLQETLSVAQLVGGGVTLAGILLAQTSR